MKTFEVIIHYEGSMSYTVEAEDEDKAKEIAESWFEDEDNDTVCENLCDSTICDCWEVK